MDFFLWLVIAVALLIVEFATRKLTAIWVTFGAMAAMSFAHCGIDAVWQLVGFVAVSGVLLLFMRPMIEKGLIGKATKADAEPAPADKDVEADKDEKEE